MDLYALVNTARPHTHTLPTVIKQSRFKVRGGLENLVKAEKKDPCLKASALANVTLVSVLLPPLAFIQHEAQTHTRHKQHCLETSPFQLRRKQYRDLIKKKKEEEVSYLSPHIAIAQSLGSFLY